MQKEQIIEWLLEGDVSIQYQVHRDLLNNDRKDLQNEISNSGWGQQFLSKRNINLHWGLRFYQPKWTSTHYTLLDLRNLNIRKDNPIVKETLQLILETHKAEDGGIQLGPSTVVHSDVCVNGMFLNYASYFGSNEADLRSIVDCLLMELMPDGGFNCRTTRSGAKHSSLHTTLSVLEGIFEFLKAGHQYRRDELSSAKESAEEFILKHHLFLSDHTGKIIQTNFLKLTFPSRWKYDILRALDYFQYTGHQWDERMKPALEVILKKRKSNRLWNMQAAHPGKVHFIMEKAGAPSRWNTLRCLRVIKHIEDEISPLSK